MVSSQFQQMSTNGVETMMAREPPVGGEPIQQIESVGRAVHHGCGDGVIQFHHRIVRHAFQQIVQRRICGQSVSSARGASS